MLTRVLLLISCSIALLAAPVGAQEATLVVENGRVIVGDGTVLERGTVVVAGDRILSVTEEPVEAPEARRIDASGKTVLPGLIDAHVHLTIGPGIRDSASLEAFLAERMPGILKGFLRHGVTTVRSTGDYWPWIGRLRDRVAAGDIAGPRILAAGPVLTAEGAHPAVTVCGADNTFCRTRLVRELETPAEAREAVRGLAAEGVDFVKLVSDSLLAPVQISGELVAAIVDQAHREGREAVGHVAEAGFMESAAESGIDGFVHPTLNAIGEARARELASVLVEHETPITTTLSAALVYGGGPVTEVLEAVSQGRKGLEAQSREIALLAGEGVPIVVGTDWCPCGPGVADDPDPAVRAGAVTVTEMEMLTWGGLSEEAILAAATREAAAALGLSSDLGTLERSKLADLIVVDGNPLEDLSALRSVEVVVKGGEVVSSKTEARAEAARPHVIGPEEAHVSVSPMGVGTAFIVGSVSTGASQLFLARATLPPGHETPEHLHEVDEEVVYVLEGELTAVLDDEEHVVGPGGTVFVPPGTWMALANRTDRPVMILGTLGRGELEQCYRVLFSQDADEADRREAAELCRIRNR